jgi:D-3-phosphoglycerate dehydrogenase
MKVVVAEKIASKGFAVLSAQKGWQVVTPEEFAKDPAAAMKDADGLIVRSAVRADEALLAKANKLKIIGRAGVGVDNVDVESATRRGIVVMNTPGASSVAVAELAMGLMLSLARRIPFADTTTRAGKWEKKSLQGTELRNKVLGIVGLGRIGIELARRATAMGMTIIATDPYASPKLAREHHVRLCSLDELYAEADYISLHLGLTPQTTRMINEEAIKKMKQGARIVNCARGELIDEAAVAAGLTSGKLGGAAVDVFTEEPPKSSPLFNAPNVVATPHIGASTQEAQEAVGIQVASQVREYLLNGVVQNAVNVLSLTDQEFAQLNPYLEASRRMASLLGQLFDSNLEEIHISYEGALREWKTELLRSAAISGVLQRDSVETVNLVNAASTAQDRGVRVVEEKVTDEFDSGINSMRITLRSRAIEITGRCTVVHGSLPRLIELNGIEIEAPLEGDFLVITNRDLPGVVGGVGGVLGKNSVNIARFSLGRPHVSMLNRASEASTTGTETRNALSIVQVDGQVAPAVLDELRKIPAIISVRSVSLG